MHYTTIEQLPITLNAHDVAGALGISRSQAYNLLHTKDFPTIHIGKRLLVPKTQFLRWMEERSGGAA